MAYSTALQLIDQFGDEEIALICDEGSLVTGALLRDAVTGADISGYTAEEQAAVAVVQARIATEQGLADGQIDSYLVQYTLPLATVPPVLNAYSLDIVRYRLWDDKAPEEVRSRYEDALRWLRDVAKGLAGLGLDADDGETGPVERTHDEEDRIFTMDTLQDF
jgi:phage gp36-like protein